jgi:hypothetical protein
MSGETLRSRFCKRPLPVLDCYQMVTQVFPVLLTFCAKLAWSLEFDTGLHFGYRARQLRLTLTMMNVRFLSG